MSFRGLSLLLVTTTLLAACGQQSDSHRDQPTGESGHDPSLNGKVLARVNEESLTTPMLDVHLVYRSGGQPEKVSAEDRETLLLELVEMELIAQDAARQGLGESPRVRARIENTRRAILAQARIAEIRGQAIDEDTLRSLYEQQYADAPLREYRARHILVDTAEEARSLIEQLESGSDFAELARQHSRGSSASRGGDLGWFRTDQVAASFARHATRLEPGDYTREPVQTEMGWHVIRMEDHRETDPPPFQEVRDRLRSRIVKSRIESYVTKLRNESDVTLFRHRE